ncbi:MAG: hypothetical protein O9972_09600, partial [Burkholderiales bacterium]|nr:hypothetical protein [Burkholderiales bacterium]
MKLLVDRTKKENLPMTCGVYFYGLVEDCIVSLKLVFSAPLYVLTICLEAVDKRALERAATKAALAKGWTLEGWRQKRLGEDDKT